MYLTERTAADIMTLNTTSRPNWQLPVREQSTEPCRWLTPSIAGLVLCVISVWSYGPHAARFDGVCLLHAGLRRAGIRTSTCTAAQLDSVLKIPRRLIFTYGNIPTSLRRPSPDCCKQQQQTTPFRRSASAQMCQTGGGQGGLSCLE